jgi:hypothetical protein
MNPKQLSCSSRVARKTLFHLRISSIWLLKGFFGKLHEYICMSKLEDRYFQLVPIQVTINWGPFKELTCRN